MLSLPNPRSVDYNEFALKTFFKGFSDRNLLKIKQFLIAGG
jgi:hypothetical protein